MVEKSEMLVVSEVEHAFMAQLEPDGVSVNLTGKAVSGTPHSNPSCMVSPSVNNTQGDGQTQPQPQPRTRTNEVAG